MNRNEAAIVAAYTGVLIGEFSDMHEYIEKILGRPVYTHQFANSSVMDEIRAAAKPDFVALSENLNDD